MRALYVGIGCDTRPFTVLSSMSLLVCADSQPVYELGMLRCRGEAQGCALASTGDCYSLRLDDAFRKAHAPLTRVKGHERRYGDRVVYLTNTALPRHVSLLLPYAPFDTLVVAGHSPHEAVLPLLSPASTLVGLHGIAFTVDDDENTVIGHCQRGRDVPFTRFLYVTRGGARYRTDCWRDFLRSTEDV